MSVRNYIYIYTYIHAHRQRRRRSKNSIFQMKKTLLAWHCVICIVSASELFEYVRGGCRTMGKELSAYMRTLEWNMNLLWSTHNRMHWNVLDGDDIPNRVYLVEIIVYFDPDLSCHCGWEVMWNCVVLHILWDARQYIVRRFSEAVLVSPGRKDECIALGIKMISFKDT